MSLFNNSQPFFSLSLSLWPPFQTYTDSMFVSEILPIIMVNNLEVLSGHNQCVVVVLVVYHQCVPAQSEITFVTTINTINLLISSLVCLSAENHFNVHLSIVTLADLVPEDDMDDDVEPKMRRIPGKQNQNRDHNQNEINDHDYFEDDDEDEEPPVLLPSLLAKRHLQWPATINLVAAQSLNSSEALVFIVVFYRQFCSFSQSQAN